MAYRVKSWVIFNKDQLNSRFFFYRLILGRKKRYKQKMFNKISHFLGIFEKLLTHPQLFPLDFIGVPRRKQTGFLCHSVYFYWRLICTRSCLRSLINDARQGFCPSCSSHRRFRNSNSFLFDALNPTLFNNFLNTRKYPEAASLSHVWKSSQGWSTLAPLPGLSLLIQSSTIAFYRQMSSTPRRTTTLENSGPPNVHCSGQC
jgi:hypothetical protein